MTVVDPDQLVPDLWWVPTSASNAYLWRTAVGRFVVVDPGLPGDDRTVLAALDRLGAAPDAVDLVVLTHFHTDHSGATPALVAATGARVAAGTRDAEVLRGRVPEPAPDLTATERPMYERIRFMAGATVDAPQMAVDVDLADGDVLDVDPRLVVHATPGHTWGSIAVHIPDRGAVLTGDIGFGLPDGRTCLGPFNVDREQAHQARARLAALGADVAGLGHGAPVRRAAAHALATAVDAFADPPDAD